MDPSAASEKVNEKSPQIEIGHTLANVHHLLRDLVHIAEKGQKKRISICNTKQFPVDMPPSPVPTYSALFKPLSFAPSEFGILFFRKWKSTPAPKKA